MKYAHLIIKFKTSKSKNYVHTFNRKHISVHFSEDKLDLLEETTPHRKKNYFTMSGFVKQMMHLELKKAEAIK